MVDLSFHKCRHIKDDAPWKEMITQTPKSINSDWFIWSHSVFFINGVTSKKIVIVIIPNNIFSKV